MWHVALSSPRTYALCERAMQHGTLPSSRTIRVGDRVTVRDVLVHDFRPDAATSCAWLDALALDGDAPAVIALLEAPASPVLHDLLQPERRFHCTEIVLTAECTADSLASMFRSVSAQGRQQEITAVLQSTWTLDPVLLLAARTALALMRRHDDARTVAPAWPSETQVLRAANIGRGRFARHAHRAGFQPALRFLQAFRVLAVAHALHARRGTIEAVATGFGYTSTATLRRHFRALTGLPPHEGRHLAVPELAQLMRRRLTAHAPPTRIA